jgi:hypothetical protein
MIYFSYKQLPELAHLPRKDRRAAWINFVCSRPAAATKVASRRLGFGIIIGMVVGICVGALTARETSIFIDMLLGILFPVVIFHFMQLYTCRAALRDYVTGEHFTLEPVSQRAATLISHGKLTNSPNPRSN